MKQLCRTAPWSPNERAWWCAAVNEVAAVVCSGVGEAALFRETWELWNSLHVPRKCCECSPLLSHARDMFVLQRLP